MSFIGSGGYSAGGAGPPPPPPGSAPVFSFGGPVGPAGPAGAAATTAPNTFSTAANTSSGANAATIGQATANRQTLGAEATAPVNQFTQPKPQKNELGG